MNGEIEKIMEKYYGYNSRDHVGYVSMLEREAEDILGDEDDYGSDYWGLVYTLMAYLDDYNDMGDWESSEAIAKFLRRTAGMDPETVESKMENYQPKED